MNQGILLIALASALLAFNTTMAKFAYMGGLTAPGLLLVRYLVGAVAFSAYVRLRGLPIIPRGALPRSMGAGLLVLLVSLLFLGAASRIPLSLAVVLVFTYPAWTVLLAHLLKIERITPGKAGAVALALAGITLAVGLDLSRLDLIGVIMAACAGLAFGLMATVGRRWSQGVDPMQVNALVSFMGIPATIVIGLATGSLTAPDSTPVWLATLGSALFYAAGFALLLTGLPKTEPTRASVTQTLEPLCTVLLAVAVLGEPMRPLQVAGAALILSGILAVALQRRPQMTATAAASSR